MTRFDRPSKIQTTYKDVDLVVTFEYTPEEPAQHYGDAPYPGAPEAIEIHEVLVGDVDISHLLDSDVIANLEQKALESL